MSMVTVSFPGDKKVQANINGFSIMTDQPVAGGGGGSAPTPFDLFLASIATCAGIYAVGFCQSKGIDTNDMKLSMDGQRNPITGLIGNLVITVTLPPNFPEKYKPAITRAMELCAVKRHMSSPPDFDIHLI